MSKSLFDQAKSALNHTKGKKSKTAQLSAMLPIAKKAMHEVQKKTKKH